MQTLKGERGNLIKYLPTLLYHFSLLAGCADFVPLCTDPGGVFSPSLFEHFGQVMNKASIWTEAQHGIRVTNVQSVDIKMHASWGKFNS